MFRWWLLVLFCLILSDLPLRAQAPKTTVRSAGPSATEIEYNAFTQESREPWRYLRGAAKVETTEVLITADEIDYNSDTAWAYARGNVKLQVFASGEILQADHAEYNIRDQEGRFFVVDGTSPAKTVTSPGILTTTNPFYFKGAWAQRIKERTVLHQGFVTDCKVPKPWWIFEAPVFDIVPGDRAIARHTVLRVGNVPLLYLPVFYRPLGKNERQSGFLTPNIGNSSNRGFMLGGGYYWAINRSYDASYQLQYFTQRGPASTVDVRGRPNEKSDFNFNFYGVNDRGVQVGNTLQKQGGYQFELTGKTEVLGFTGRIDYNYLSSYLFRQSFSYSFVGAVFSEVDATGYLQRHFRDNLYSLNLVFQRNQLFESVLPGDQVTIQKLPSIEFSSDQDEIVHGKVPVWFSFNSSVALARRQEPTFQTGGATERTNVEPSVMTAFQFKGFSLVPSFHFGATSYGDSYAVNSTIYVGQTPSTGVILANSSLFRHDADFGFELATPIVERLYSPPKWLHLGNKLKHTVEGRATYEYVTGIDSFDRIIHFDDLDLRSNTNQLEISLTNRLYRKDKSGKVDEILSWQIAQRRYFDPTFGGAIINGQRNVVMAAEEFTPLAFLNGPRSYSPVVSTLRVQPLANVVFEWRADYDPYFKRFTNSTINATVRLKNYFANVGQIAINTDPILNPPSEQVRFSGGYGSTNRKGWNAAASADYDFRQNYLIYQMAQISYNTDCCGWSMQFRRFAFGARNENQVLFSFALANIGTFGSLQKQARIF